MRLALSGDTPSEDAIKAQYNRLAEDWRQFNNLLWGIPSVAVSIMTGLVFAAYHVQGLPRVISLAVGSIFLFALTLEVIKKRLLMNAVSDRLKVLQEQSGLKLDKYEKKPTKYNFEYDLDDPKWLQETSNAPPLRNPEDPLFQLLRNMAPNSRQWLAGIIFLAFIVVASLAGWELYRMVIKYLVVIVH